MKCPDCNKTMQWQEGLLSDSGARNMEVGRHYCPDCYLFASPEESRALKKGRRMAHSLVGVHAMDKKITSNSVAVQIGILRERQHCTTCGNIVGEVCKCINCKCLYCQHYK
jgi:hypothetical protein